MPAKLDRALRLLQIIEHRAPELGAT